jgi:hypothetical protein
MAAVAATRHLRDCVRVADGGRVCLRPVTTAIYQLFLDDLHARGERRAPDCPGPAPLTTQDGVAVGVHGSDAVAFLAWLNDLVGGEVAYRLPVRAEVDHLAARRPLGAPPPSVWLAPNGDRDPELWTPPGSRHPHAIDRSILRRHLDADLGNAPLLVALLLTRSRVLLLNLARSLDLIRDRAQALGRPLALVHHRDRDRSRSLDEVLDRARARARGLARELARDGLLRPDLPSVRALALDLAPALLRDREDALDRDRATAHALGLDRGRDLARTLDFDQILDLAWTLGVVLDRDVARASQAARTGSPDGAVTCEGSLALHGGLTRAFDLVRPLAREFHLDLAIDQDLDVVFGNALAQTLADALDAHAASQESPATASFQARFAGRLLELAAVPASDRIVALDKLAGHARAARSNLLRHLPAEQSLPGAATPWALEVAGRLEGTAVLVFTRQQRPDQQTAAAIRLAALCLAAEAHQPQGGGAALREQFQALAAGITLLERRCNGQARPTESILAALA